MTNPIETIHTWWDEFARRAVDVETWLAGEQAWDLPQWMHERLQMVHPHLQWEFGPALRGKGHRLVITPAWRRHLRLLVQQLVVRAPQLAGWEFYAYRQPEEFSLAQFTVQNRSGGDISKTFFRASVNRFHQIDLVFLAEDYPSSEDRQATNDVFVAAEALLGEEILDRWIGAIEVAPLAPGPDRLHDIRKLDAVVRHLIGHVQQDLPQEPYCRLPDDGNWAVYKLEPEPADDYPGQADMTVGKSMVPAMWINAHSGAPFDSVRFSRHGEVFGYLKIDATPESGETSAAEKTKIEEAVDQSLQKADAGRVVGGGFGLRYHYVDMALADVNRSVEIVRQALREKRVPKRSWILFFDTDCQCEWLGIWDDSPPPPMANLSE